MQNLKKENILFFIHLFLFEIFKYLENSLKDTEYDRLLKYFKTFLKDDKNYNIVFQNFNINNLQIPPKINNKIDEVSRLDNLSIHIENYEIRLITKNMFLKLFVYKEGLFFSSLRIFES